VPNGPAQPKGILFDLDDTLISAYGKPEVAWLKIAHEFATTFAPLPPEDFAAQMTREAKAFWDNSPKEWRMKLPQARRIIVKNALEKMPTRTQRDMADTIADRFTRLRTEEMHLFPGAHETLDEFKSRGIRLALITNGAGPVQREKIARFALAHRFDHIQIEGEHGFGKPEEQAYRHALKSLDISAHEAWMVGDNLEWEVEAPQRLGIHAIWHDTHGLGLPAGSAVRPNRIVTKLTQLLNA
jgi:putative hydrolase of the HAD superfamily